MGATIAVPLVAALVTAGAGMYQSNQAQNKATHEADLQEKAQQTAINQQDAKDKATMDQQAQTAQAAQALAKFRMAAFGNAGSMAGGTVLTGGLGAPMAPNQPKTLLGG